jgi:hypothetical protein
LNLRRKELKNEINNQTASNEHIILKNLKTKLANVCMTRWVERHTSVETFYELYPAVIDVLQELIHDKEKEVSTKAHLFFNSLLPMSPLFLRLRRILTAIQNMGVYVLHLIG